LPISETCPHTGEVVNNATAITQPVLNKTFISRPNFLKSAAGPGYRVMLLTCEYISSAALMTLEFDS